MFLSKVERLLLQNQSFRFHSCWQHVCLQSTPGRLLTQRYLLTRRRVHAHIPLDCPCAHIQLPISRFCRRFVETFCWWIRCSCRQLLAQMDPWCHLPCGCCVLRGFNNSVFAVENDSAVGNSSVFSKQGYDRMTPFGQQDPGCSYIR